LTAGAEDVHAAELPDDGVEPVARSRRIEARERDADGSVHVVRNERDRAAVEPDGDAPFIL
jgi:hypothetical protein